MNLFPLESFMKTKIIQIYQI